MREALSFVTNIFYKTMLSAWFGMSCFCVYVLLFTYPRGSHSSQRKGGPA